MFIKPIAYCLVDPPIIITSQLNSVICPYRRNNNPEKLPSHMPFCFFSCLSLRPAQSPLQYRGLGARWSNNNSLAMSSCRKSGYHVDRGTNGGLIATYRYFIYDNIVYSSARLIRPIRWYSINGRWKDLSGSVTETGLIYLTPISHTIRIWCPRMHVFHLFARGSRSALIQKMKMVIILDRVDNGLLSSFSVCNFLLFCLFWSFPDAVTNMCSQCY